MEDAQESDLGGLIAAARRGDTVARNRLIERNVTWIQAVVRINADPLLRQKESCSDIAQSVCREIMEHLDGFEYRGEAGFRSWLYAWALNKLRSRRKFYLQQKRDVRREVHLDAASASSHQRLLECYASFCSPSNQAERREEVLRIEDALDRLSEDHRNVILYARILELPHAEIANRMGRGEQATRALLRRAIVRLAALLDGEGSGRATDP